MPRGSSSWRSACVPVLRRIRGAELTIEEPGRAPLSVGQHSANLRATIEVHNPERF